MSFRLLPMTLVAAALCAASAAALAQPVVSYARTGAKFEDVRDDLKQAIESRGLVIDYQAQIGKMLERTGADVGSAKPIFVDAQSMQFCSAKLSRRTMEADPANVALCPYTLVVYATVGQPGRVVVAYRRPVPAGGAPASRTAVKEVEALLDAIAREAAGRK